jgi:hypothetical protein
MSYLTQLQAEDEGEKARFYAHDTAQTDRVVVALAEKVATAAADITEQDIQQARDAGLSDDDILNVMLAAAARCFFSKILDGTGTQADSELRTKLPPSLIDVLVVGRPIEESGSAAGPMS